MADARSWLWLPHEACFDSQALGETFRAALVNGGAEVRNGRVGGLVLDGRRAAGVRLEDGSTLTADAVVIAAGAWSPAIEALPRPLPIEPVRGQIVRLRPSGAPDLSVVVSDHDGRYAVPRRDGSIVAGSTMEHAGFANAPTDEGRRLVRRAVEALVPALRRAVEIESWAGLRPLSVDDLPIVGPEPLLEGLYYATGFGRRGMLIGPLVGALLAEMISDETTPPAIAAFGPERFALAS